MTTLVIQTAAQFDFHMAPTGDSLDRRFRDGCTASIFHVPATVDSSVRWTFTSMAGTHTQGGVASDLRSAIISIEAARIKDIELRADRSMGLAWFKPQAE